MPGNGKSGRNGRYTAQQFIDAIPETGGIVSAIAEKVGCAWHTAKGYIEGHPTVKQAWENERHRITDIARNNILDALDKGDVQTSKWWLQVMDPEFVPTERRQITGLGGAPIKVEYVNDWRNPIADASRGAAGNHSE